MNRVHLRVPFYSRFNKYLDCDSVELSAICSGEHTHRCYMKIDLAIDGTPKYDKIWYCGAMHKNPPRWYKQVDRGKSKLKIFLTCSFRISLLL